MNTSSQKSIRWCKCMSENSNKAPEIALKQQFQELLAHVRSELRQSFAFTLGYNDFSGRVK